jgi:hypothetical protein
LQVPANRIFSGHCSWNPFICSNRELAEYVHQDFSFQPYLNAVLIMLRFEEDALSPTNPYRGSKTQFADITFGSKNILSVVVQAARVFGQRFGRSIEDLEKL